MGRLRSPLADGLTGRTALVTGAGSGIGLAISRALVAAGASVVVSDLDGEAAAAAAASMSGPGAARALALDVTDASAVAAAVSAVADAGRLDLLVNNAGICWGGDTEDLTLAHWESIIDVNLRGVVHGVHAAYPLMLRQAAADGWGGQIVNVASMAGLLAAGQLTSYVATKHAVVGLSLALRSEAASRGVGVTVVCPAAVETPILDRSGVGAFHGRDYFVTGQGARQALDPDVLAAEVLTAVRRDQALLVTPRLARVQWRLNRLAPGLVRRASVGFVERQRRSQAARVAGG